MRDMDTRKLIDLIRGAADGEPGTLDALLGELERRLETEPERLVELWHELPRAPGRAHRVGIMGPPRVGKSSLVGRLADQWVERENRVGVLSVESPGGATPDAHLGRRPRVGHHDRSGVVDVRTLAARPGEIPPALHASLSADVLDVLGCDPVLIESANLRRPQLEVVRRVHSVVLVLAPSGEDPVAILDSGLLDLADLVVLNRSDAEGAEGLARTLERALEGRGGDDDPRPPRLFRTVAIKDAGVVELVTALEEHASGLRASGAFVERSRAQAREQLLQLLVETLRTRWRRDVGLRTRLDRSAKRILDGEIDLLDAVAELAQEVSAPRR